MVVALAIESESKSTLGFSPGDYWVEGYWDFKTRLQRGLAPRGTPAGSTEPGTTLSSDQTFFEREVS